MPFFDSHQHRLFYREQGSGELLLILPGNTASSALHKAELEYFGRRFQAAALDFLGTASSSDSLLPQIGSDVASMAAQVPQSQAYLYHDGGHPLMWSAPDRFRAAADLFLLQVTEQ